MAWLNSTGWFGVAPGSVGAIAWLDSWCKFWAVVISLIEPTPVTTVVIAELTIFELLPVITIGTVEPDTVRSRSLGVKFWDVRLPIIGVAGWLIGWPCKFNGPDECVIKLTAGCGIVWIICVPFCGGLCCGGHAVLQDGGIDTETWNAYPWSFAWTSIL